MLNQCRWGQTVSQCHHQQSPLSTTQHPRRLVCHLYHPPNIPRNHICPMHISGHLEGEARRGVELPGEVCLGGEGSILTRDLMMVLLGERRRGGEGDIGRGVRRLEGGGGLRSQRGIGVRPTFDRSITHMMKMASAPRQCCQICFKLQSPEMKVFFT